MRKLIAFLFATILATPSFAADNAVILDPGTTITMRTKDVGAGVQSPFNILGDTSGSAIYGTAGSANANVLSIQGITSMTPLLANPGTAANWGVGATAAAVPANTNYIGVNVGGTLTGLAPGTAGTASTQVFTVQGVTSMTPVQVSQATAATLNATVVGTGTFATQSAVTAASGSYSSGAFASGSFASGSHASGSFASGAFASGSVASGAMVDLGAQADSACGTDTGTCSLIALQKRGNQNTSGALAAGSNTIGNTIPAPTASSSLALTHIVCGSAASSCVLKAAAGNFYGVYAECSAACWLMVFNAISAPSNGSTTAGTASGNMVECIAIPAGDQRSLNYPTFPIALSVGITAAISSTTCATLTLATTGFIHGTVQ